MGRRLPGHTFTSDIAVFSSLLVQYRGVLTDYASAATGSVGRLVFSLIYFIALANTLSIEEFGLFATAAATGVVLSRIGAFGFISPLYRIATVKPRLIGTYTAGYLALLPLSVPVIIIAALSLYLLIFAGKLAAIPFALIIAAEVLFYRGYEVVIIVNHGMGRFARGAVMSIFGTLVRAGAALALSFTAAPDIEIWSLYYLLANAFIFVISVVIFYPRQRLRFRRELYGRRLQDALSVSVADILFYLQMELDKLLVLSFGGASLAGIYAIIMRLADLTAMPIRIFNMMLVQSLMRDDRQLKSKLFKSAVEGSIFVLSCLALTAAAVILYFFPTLLGNNVSKAAPLLVVAILIPGFRNLIEYHAELLYARGQTVRRTINLAVLAAAKAGLLVWLLVSFSSQEEFITWTNFAFAALYLLSFALTHPALQERADRI